MSRWALTLLVFAVVGVLFRFGGLAATPGGTGKTLFFLLLIVFLMMLVFKVAVGKRVF